MQTRIPGENRQPRSRPHQNPSNRRRTVPQVPLSNRTTQLSRMTTRSSRPIVSSRGRGRGRGRARLPRFPLEMDLDMVFSYPFILPILF